MDSAGCDREPQDQETGVRNTLKEAMSGGEENDISKTSYEQARVNANGISTDAHGQSVQGARSKDGLEDKSQKQP